MVLGEGVRRGLGILQGLEPFLHRHRVVVPLVPGVVGYGLELRSQGSYVQLSLQDPAGVIRQGALDLLVLFVIGLAGFLGLLGNRQRGLLRGRRKLRRKRSAGVGIPGQGQDGVGSTTHDHQNGDDGEGTLVPLPLALLLVQLPFQGFHEMLVYLAHLFLSRMPLFPVPDRLRAVGGRRLGSTGSKGAQARWEAAHYSQAGKSVKPESSSRLGPA